MDLNKAIFKSETELERDLISCFQSIGEGCWVYPMVYKSEIISFENPIRFESQAIMRRFLWGQPGSYLYIAIVNLKAYSEITMRGKLTVKSFDNFLSSPTLRYYKNKSLKMRTEDKSQESISRMKEIFSSVFRKSS